jgi:hypothetical protein
LAALLQTTEKHHFWCKTASGRKLLSPYFIKSVHFQSVINACHRSQQRFLLDVDFFSANEAICSIQKLTLEIFVIHTGQNSSKVINLVLAAGPLGRCKVNGGVCSMLGFTLRVGRFALEGREIHLSDSKRVLPTIVLGNLTGDVAWPIARVVAVLDLTAVRTLSSFSRPLV